MSKKYIIIALILAALAIIILKGWLTAKDDVSQTKGPVAEVSPLTYDLGTVIYGQVATHTLAVKNLGNEPLIIQKISTSCGCTKAFINEEDKTIAPGKEAAITVTFDPATHKDDTDVGEITRVVYIKTNDPNNAEVQSEFNALVIKK